MDFYLTAPDGSRLHFPVNPRGEITCDTGSVTQTFDIIGLGEIVLPRGRTSVRFSFEGIFPGPARRNDSIAKDWRDPKELVGQLSAWRNQGVKLRLLVTETPINHDVYFDGDGSFQHRWLGGHGDCWYSLRFVEARELLIQTEAEAVTAASSASGAAGSSASTVGLKPRPAPAAPRTYTVKAGDTLWAVAKQQLGDGNRWREIYQNNVAVIGPDPNIIRPGQVLRLT